MTSLPRFGNSYPPGFPFCRDAFRLRQSGASSNAGSANSGSTSYNSVVGTMDLIQTTLDNRKDLYEGPPAQSLEQLSQIVQDQGLIFSNAIQLEAIALKRMAEQNRQLNVRI